MFHASVVNVNIFSTMCMCVCLTDACLRNWARTTKGGQILPGRDGAQVVVGEVVRPHLGRHEAEHGTSKEAHGDVQGRHHDLPACSISPVPYVLSAGRDVTPVKSHTKRHPLRSLPHSLRAQCN